MSRSLPYLLRVAAEADVEAFPTSNEVMEIEPREHGLEGLGPAAVRFAHEPGFAVAGSSILSLYAGTAIDDVDVFALSPRLGQSADQILTSLGYSRAMDKTWVLPSAADLTVQVIDARPAPGIGALLQSFDLSICQFGVHEGTFYATRLAQMDARARVLRCTGALFLSDLVERVYKYQARGFRVLDMIESKD